MGLQRWAGRRRRQRPRNQLRRGLANDSLRTATVSGERIVIHLQQEWIVSAVIEPDAFQGEHFLSEHGTQSSVLPTRVPIALAVPAAFSP